MSENPMDDTTMDEALRRAAARDYNAPPATPREAMWERIAAARAASRDATVGPPDVAVVPIDLHRTRVVRGGRRPAWALPLAAALLLGVGIGVGRYTATDRAASTLAPVATAPVGPPDGALPSQPLPPSHELASTTNAAARRAVGRAGKGAESREPTAESRTSIAPLAFRLAAAEHLLSTETLLATVSADARAGRADSSVSVWARDLLGTTRVLLDSPAARDPEMARLLQDLELVLAQVAQLRASRGAEDLQAIDRAVRRRDVMTRVRAAVPAGPLTAGT